MFEAVGDAASGALTCRRSDGRVLGLCAFDIYDLVRVVEIVHLRNFTYTTSCPERVLPGLGETMLTRLRDGFPGYELRLSLQAAEAPGTRSRSATADFINHDHGERALLPVHGHDCFTGAHGGCVCVLGGRRRTIH